MFNIVGNYFLIYGIGPFPELGLVGAGLSTLFSRILVPVILLAVLLYRKRYAIYRQGIRLTPLRGSEMRYINRRVPFPSRCKWVWKAVRLPLVVSWLVGWVL